MLDKSPDDRYTTTDLKLAAYLKAKRAYHIKSDPDIYGKVTFTFGDRVTCEELVGEMYCGPVEVSLPDYWAAEHSLRETIKMIQFKRDGRNG